MEKDGGEVTPWLALCRSEHGRNWPNDCEENSGIGSPPTIVPCIRVLSKVGSSGRRSWGRANWQLFRVRTR